MSSLLDRLTAGQYSLQIPPVNVTGAERWLSLAAGIVLTLAAGRRKGLLRSLALSGAGAALIGRGATGRCAIKSMLSNTAPSIDNMHVLYVVELQELYSAEHQMADLVERIATGTAHANLATRFRTYATELRSRAVELDKVLTSIGAPAHGHPDQGIRALLGEAQKVAQIAVPTVRDAALLTSLQRIVHYKIAGYGAVGTYAASLGRKDERMRFEAYAEFDKQIDTELAEFAQEVLNPNADPSPVQVTAEMRTH